MDSVTESRRKRKAERQRLWRAANPGRTAEYARKWRQKDPARAAAVMRKYREANRGREYGLNTASRDAMLITQAGRCDMCGDPMRYPHVDHCHDTGVVRALLCNICNCGLGYITRPNFVELAQDYLARHHPKGMT